MRPWLLLTCGYPFSGKSTLATRIVEMFDFALVAVDDLHVRHGLNIDVDVVHDRDWVLAYKSGYQDLERHLSEGRSSIFDSIGFTRKDRDRLRRMADRHGAEALTIWLDVTESDARQRLDRNRVNRARPNVPVTSFDRIVAQFEVPEPDETHVIYQPTEVIEDWLERVLRPVLEQKD